MNVVIISLRYAPGNWQHMMSFCSQLEGRGNSVVFLLADEFRPFVKEAKLKNDIRYSGCSKKTKSIIDLILNFARFIPLARDIATRDHKALFVIWHPLNFYMMALLKHFNSKFNISLWLHEPYKEDKSKYGDKRYYFYITEFIQGLSYRLVDNFVLHSRYALNLFRKYIEPRLKGHSFNVHLVPLQYRNIAEAILGKSERRYFSYVGNVAYAKGFDIFLELTRRMKDSQFALTTSSEINVDLNPLGNLSVVNGKVLNDSEIAESLCKSFATLCLYRDSTQSGVIPFSFMCGTPVLVSNLSAFEEYIRDRYNCVIVRNLGDYREIEEGINYLRDNFATLSRNCMETFKEFFDDRNFDRYYAWFLELP